MFAISNRKYTIVIINNHHYTMINFFIEINFVRNVSTMSYDKYLPVNALEIKLLDGVLVLKIHMEYTCQIHTRSTRHLIQNRDM